MFAIELDAFWVGVIWLALLLVKEYFDRQRARLASGKIEDIRKATNGMKDQLVLITEKEALARGGVEERARADARDEAHGHRKEVID